ncbi:Crp/Fnr family transcriptional regulator [Streptomyces sp. NPDC048484]|uniref:Crp/Fnr family transcriptional regulator n=1 Tax=Streptomyces sp. NPDC048484 TaxID=3155146 RepID=UPI00343B87CF
MPPKVDAFRTADVLQGRQRMPKGSFLGHLSSETWKLLVNAWGSDARVYERDEVLPTGPDRQYVHIVLGGCVRQDRFPFGDDDGSPTITRFRGVGQVLGEAKLIEPRSHVLTTCLTTTWVMPCFVPRMHAFFRKAPDVQLALLRSLEDRNRSDEIIYTMAARTPLRRVAGLLAHLAEGAEATEATEATEAPGNAPGASLGARVTIAGPSQKDMAAALLLGLSTVENAVRDLRNSGVLDNKYRQFVVSDLAALHGIAAAVP